MNIKELINENKQKHVFGVAQFMYDEAPKYGLDSEKMYVLGLLHDIGYLCGDFSKHEEYGANLMKELGFIYSEEISLHGYYPGKCDVNNISKEALLLMAADSCVNYKGDVGTYEHRRKDIEDRYGDDKDVFLERFDKRIKLLKENGFNY